MLLLFRVHCRALGGGVGTVGPLVRRGDLAPGGVEGWGGGELGLGVVVGMGLGLGMELGLKLGLGMGWQVGMTLGLGFGMGWG